MAYDRKQFQATSTKTLKKLKEEQDEMFGNEGESTPTLEIKSGLNKIRLAPKFPGEKEFYHLYKRTWVPYEKEDGTMTKIPIFDSKLHGGTKLDIIEEYVNFVKTKLMGVKGEEEKIKKVTHWKEGLVPTVYWKAYGWKLVKDQDPKFGFFEFKKSVRDELCSLSIIEDEDEAIDVDPFTDLEDGKPILLTYNPEAKKASDYYDVKLSKNSFPITDEMFEQLVSCKPISELSLGIYGIEDFEKALAGIRYYDADNEIDLCDDEEFEEIIFKVRSQYSKSSSQKSEKSKPTSKKVEDDEEEEEEEEKPKNQPKKKVTVEVEEEEEEEEETEEEDEEEEEEEKPSTKKVEEEKPKKLTIEELRAKLAARKNS